MNKIPIITLDGPSGSGKGTVGRCLAARLGWHFLDSGALYRVVALAAIQTSIAPEDEASLCAVARALEVVFEENGRMILMDQRFPLKLVAPLPFDGTRAVGSIDTGVPDAGGEGRWEKHSILQRESLDTDQDISVLIRSEECSQMASKIALLPTLREALLVRQRAFCREPGLVADGRDMGTVVFPEAPFKFFLEASLEQRVARRDRQLKETGQNVSLEDLRRQMVLRDERDSARANAPLKPARDAVVIETTIWGVEAVCEQILQRITQISTKFS